ncbi:hypothetical protein QBC43DRAFT_360536 [Cladorrhinum sp. PSN259]|nr:hypothetical protein QBC43DRAFT_360536 [Cladorrhinum sp. PSN259]
MLLSPLFTSSLLFLTSFVSAQPGYGETSKYCASSSTPSSSGGANVTGICYLQYYMSPTAPLFRIAIPSDAQSNTEFDTILEIIAPLSLKWVGFAWGGGMTLNPLTVAWPNEHTVRGVVVTSRWATGRTLPKIYSATHTLLSQTRNATHWSVEIVCKGCSRWTGGSLNTAGSAQFAWALSRSAPQNPGSSSSTFPIHNNVGMISEPLDFAKNSREVWSGWVNKPKTT